MPKFEITQLARKFAPWSFSKIEAAEMCPAQFGHKHITKTAAAPMPSDTKIGIVAHEILEHRAGGKSAGESKQLAIAKNPLTSDETEMLTVLNENMEAFLKRFDSFCKANGVTEILREADWAFTDTYEKTTFFDKQVYFRGKLDLGAVTRDRDLFFVDHKAGAVKKLAEDRVKREQLQAYAVLALVNVPNLAGVRGGINFLQGDTPEKQLQWGDYIPATRVRELYVSWLFSRINRAADNLLEPLEARPANSLIKKGAFAGRPGFPCGWCLYQSSCVAFKEKFGG
jgi:hypothetical protein